MAWQKRPNRLLSVDTARITGIAWGALSDQLPQTDVWELPDYDRADSLGARIATLENTLHDFIAWADIDTVVIAERFPPRTSKQMASGYGLDGAVRSQCWRDDVQLLWQPEGQVRKEILGRSRGTTRDQLKAAAVRWCEHHGIHVQTDDAADAAVLWCWTRNTLVRHRPPGIRTAPSVQESAVS